jgi:hypothetical protein
MGVSSARKGLPTSVLTGSCSFLVALRCRRGIAVFLQDCFTVCVFITAVPNTVCVYYCRTLYKAVYMGGGGDMGGHVLRETTIRGLCGLVCPSRTSERGGEGDCVKEGGGEEGKCERERA